MLCYVHRAVYTDRPGVELREGPGQCHRSNTHKLSALCVWGASWARPSVSALSVARVGRPTNLTDNAQVWTALPAPEALTLKIRFLSLHEADPEGPL